MKLLCKFETVTGKIDFLQAIISTYKRSLGFVFQNELFCLKSFLTLSASC